MKKERNIDKEQQVTTRNYQIDVLKLICAILIFLIHTVQLVDQTDTKLISKMHNIGWISVLHCFFIISGFLMIQSIEKRNFDPKDAGKHSLNYVLNKYKQIALPFTVAVFISLTAYIALYLLTYLSKTRQFPQSIFSGMSPIDLFVKSIPEFLGINQAGYGFCIYGLGWYISAMILAMLPLAYILIKNRDFYIYVFSPISAIFLLGYLLNSNNYPEEPLYRMITDIDKNTHWGLERAICGICFGAIAWIIYKTLCSIPNKRIYRILTTIIEVITGGLLVYVCIIRYSKFQTLYCITLLLPIVIGIMFSKKSYISELFNFNWLKCCGPLSLTIYLNHAVPTLAAGVLCTGKVYWIGLAFTILLTIVCSAANLLGVKILKAVGRKVAFGANKNYGE